MITTRKKHPQTSVCFLLRYLLRRVLLNFFNAYFVVSVMNMDMEVEVITIMKGVIVSDFITPSSMGACIHDNLMFMVMEAEAHVEDNMRSGEQFNDEGSEKSKISKLRIQKETK